MPAVDKIVGPGNIYVATAKRLVFGTVGIDMVAGPSEILVICDGVTDPDWIAMDLFSQAEHDEDAQAILLSPDAEFLDAVARQYRGSDRGDAAREIIDQSMSARGALIKVADLDEAAEVANYIAPEHLELSVENAQEYAARSVTPAPFPRALHRRSAGRLLRRTQPRVADLAHRALFIAARGLRFSRSARA